MAKDEPVMTADEAESTSGPIVAVYLLKVTLRGEGVKAPTIDKITKAVALVVEDVADDINPDLDPNAPLPHASVTGERVDK